MPRSIAVERTENASRYLQQLCKHWSHRFKVDFDLSKGKIDFGSGQTVELHAADTSLTISVEDEKESGLHELEKVVADHLRRFAFRETLTFNWAREDQNRRHDP